MKKPILNLTTTEWSVWLAERQQPAYRAKQVRHWIAVRRATSFDAMSDLPARLRQQLADDFVIFGSQIDQRSLDQTDSTRKLLVELQDGKTIECVLLLEEERRTVCLSTQVGCAMGCVFCASGLAGVERNLTTAEMIEELVLLRNLLPENERLSHIVVMGMGEPTANLENLIAALDFASSPDGLGLSARHITISTVGMPAKIKRLAEVGKPYHLAVSLHAPNEDVRQRIVPTARRVRLVDILDAADEYRARTNRQVTFEYVLLAGINDQAPHAVELTQLLAGRDCLINLIPYNPVAGLPYATPDPVDALRFARILRQAGYTVKIRKRKGANIDAACGQLRRRLVTDSSAATTGLVTIGTREGKPPVAIAEASEIA